jgi:hypothetical protein
MSKDWIEQEYQEACKACFDTLMCTLSDSNKTDSEKTESEEIYRQGLKRCLRIRKIALDEQPLRPSLRWMGDY